MTNVLFYKLTCLTNLHMGNGDVNYDIVDLAVERDSVLGEPTMNASGVKGALRDYFRKQGVDKAIEIKIFGSDANETDPTLKKSGTCQGTYHFLSGDLIARPVRVSNGKPSYVLATTPDLLRHIGNKMTAFGIQNPFEGIPEPTDSAVITGADCTDEIEGINTKKADGTQNYCKELKNFFGTENWAIMSPTQLKNIDLPVMAHNVLKDGLSQNLWYEQVVPHESVFGLIIIASDENSAFESVIKNGTIVQFGAGATTGNGFVKMERL